MNVSFCGKSATAQLDLLSPCRIAYLHPKKICLGNYLAHPEELPQFPSLLPQRNVTANPDKRRIVEKENPLKSGGWPL